MQRHEQEVNSMLSGWDSLVDFHTWPIFADLLGRDGVGKMSMGSAEPLRGAQHTPLGSIGTLKPKTKNARIREDLHKRTLSNAVMCVSILFVVGLLLWLVFSTQFPPSQEKTSTPVGVLPIGAYRNAGDHRKEDPMDLVVRIDKLAQLVYRHPNVDMSEMDHGALAHHVLHAFFLEMQNFEGYNSGVSKVRGVCKDAPTKRYECEMNTVLRILAKFPVPTDYLMKEVNDILTDIDPGDVLEPTAVWN